MALPSGLTFTRVMLMMRGPGGFTGGKVSDAMVSHIDLFPTICDLLRIERPAWLQGKSMLPLMTVEEQTAASATVTTPYQSRCRPPPQGSGAVARRLWRRFRPAASLRT